MIPQSKRTFDEQGYIFFTTRLYPVLPKEDRESIESLCQGIAGAAWKALLSYIRGEDCWQKKAIEHGVSPASLRRWKVKYYDKFLE